MIDPSLFEAHVGPNSAHRALKQSIVSNKVLLFLFQTNRDLLRNSFMCQFKAADPEKGPFGLITEVLSPTQVRLMNIPYNEAVLAASNYEEFEAHAYASMYVQIHRALSTYFVQLHAELPTEAASMARVVKQKKNPARMDRRELHGEFDRVGLAITPPGGLPTEEADFLTQEYLVLWATRNVLEHNDGVVNESFIRNCRASGRQPGETIKIDVAMLGRAFAAAEGVSDNLNKRALAKFPDAAVLRT